MASVRNMNRKRLSVILVAISLSAGIVIWQLAASLASPLVMATLPEIWDVFKERLGNGSLLTDLISTLSACAYGFVISAVVGIIIGVVMGSSFVADKLLDPWVTALYSTPLITLAPLFIVVFGIGLSAKVAIVILLAIFPVIINTTIGIKTSDPDLIETAKSFGASRVQQFTVIRIPSALPIIVTGLRLAIGRALIAVVVAEFFGSRHGLGRMIFTDAQNFNTAGVFLGVFILAGIGVVLVKLMYVMESFIAPWRKYIAT